MKIFNLFKKKETVKISYSDLIKKSEKIAFDEGWFVEDIRDLKDDLSNVGFHEAVKMFKSIFDKKHHFHLTTIA